MRFILFATFAVLSATTSSQLPNYISEDGLLAWWSLNGTGEDLGPNGFHGTIMGEAFPVVDRHGVEGGALEFQGNQWVDMGVREEWFPEAFTINAWYWTYEWPDPADYRSVVAKGDTYMLFVGDGSGGASGGANSSFYGSSTDHLQSFENNSDGSWHMMTGVREGNGGALRFYVDGELVDEAVAGNELNLAGSQQPLSIGRFYSYNPHFFNGGIDDVGFWSRSLDGAEVLALFNAESPTTGCTDELACNYNPEANVDDGSCLDCALFEERCGPGTMWDESVQLCMVANPSDTNFDGCVSMTDLLDLLTVFGTCNEVPWSCGDSLEYQGYDYETVQIGEQCWFAENLRAENYGNGDAIPTVLNLDDWIELSSGAQTSYSNDENLIQHHGLLYNWFAVMDPRRICPTGWHEPSNVDWVGIETHLGLDGALVDVEGWRGSVGFQLKNDETSEVSWNGSNEAGFNGTPSGYRQLSGGSSGFVGLGSRGEYWTTSNATSDASNKISRSLDTDQEALGLSPNSPNCGFSVRCIQDSE